MFAYYFLKIDDVLIVNSFTLKLFPYLAIPLFFLTTFSEAPAALFNDVVSRFSDFSPSLVTKKVEA